MILPLILLAAIGVIVLAERSAEHLPFAIAALFFSAAAILVIVGDFDRAVLLAGVLAAAIIAASVIKYHHSALKLSVTDLPLMFAGTVPFFISQYPRAVLAVLTGGVALIAAAIAIVMYGTAALLLLDLHGLADQSSFLAAIWWIDAERYCE
jgi:hypothetical protein